jgi:hypothetical protein
MESAEGYSMQPPVPVVYQTQQKGFWSSLSERDKHGLLIAGISATVGTILFFVGKYVIRRVKQRNLSKTVVFDNSPANYVQVLYNAFENAGTDEYSVYQAFADMPTVKFYLQVSKAYEIKESGTTLGERLAEELDSEELQVVSNIIKAKPVKKGTNANYSLLSNWVSRLMAASGSWNTDEEAIYKVLYEIPDHKGINLVSQELVKQNKTSLSEFLTDQLDEDELSKAQEIINRKNLKNEYQ